MIRIVLLSLVIFITACGEQADIVKLTGTTMGTTWSVQIAESTIRPDAIHSLEASINQRLKIINHEFSTYQDDSTISRFNQHKATTPFRVSEEFFKVAKTAQTISELTHGAFDPTLAPLIQLWGFDTAVVTALPDKQSIAAIKPLIGYQQLILNENKHTLQKKIPALSINYSAIAKGYAVDQLADLLLQRGYDNFLVEIGGELKANGRKTDHKPWTIAIAKPQPGQPEAMQKIILGNESIATSGNYNNFFIFEGKRYGHTLNPQTGRPVTHSLASATVRHKSAMIADALATALMVMGSKDGLTFANQQQLAVFLVDQVGSTFHSYPSRYFIHE